MSNLNTLVERYGNLKNDMDLIKKDVDADNKEIKKLMKETSINEFKSDNYIAKYSVRVSESFDEDKLIEKLNHMTYTPEGGSFSNVLVATGLNIVKMKPYVDMEALENAIYKGYVNAADLADCKIIKETPTLIIKTKEK